MSFSPALDHRPLTGPVWLTAGLGVLVDLILPWTRHQAGPLVTVLLIDGDTRLVTGGLFPTRMGGPDRAATAELRGLLGALVRDPASCSRLRLMWPVLLRLRGGPDVTMVGDRLWSQAIDRETRPIGLPVATTVVATPQRRFVVGRDGADLTRLQLIWHTGRARGQLRLAGPIRPGYRS